MPTIRIDDEVFEHLKQHAEPLKDTANDVLRRLFGLNENSDRSKKTKFKRKMGLKTPGKEYWIPILEAIEELGGSGRADDILDKVFEKIKGKLNSFDREELASGSDIRWSNTAKWERHNMKKKGFLRDDSPRGIWEITERGREHLKSSR